jgi:putative transposase
MTNDEMKPRDHAEAVALFRAQVVGELVARTLARGDLEAELQEKSQQRFRAPGSEVTRCYSVPTLQRWYYRLRSGGLEALRPRLRSDRGVGRALGCDLRSLMLGIRQENPSMSAALILETLERLGRVQTGAVSANTIRRLYRNHELRRVSKRHQTPGKERRRWEAACPGALWHADVCHGPTLEIDGQKKPLRIHGVLDDHSRYVVALVARHSEQEVDMLGIFTDAVRRWGRPKALYLDNGSTYRGDVLRVACERLGVRLVHAQPHDPQARGKMERFWRTLRERCLDHLPASASLHDVQMRLYAFLDEWYHLAPHAGLVGYTPSQRWATREMPQVSEQQLCEALVVRTERLVSGDGVVSVGGLLWEVDASFLAGRKVVIERSLAAPQAAPWVVYADQRRPLRPVRVLDNSHRRRAEPPKRSADIDRVPFDPMQPLVDAAIGRGRNEGGAS